MEDVISHVFIVISLQYGSSYFYQIQPGTEPEGIDIPTQGRYQNRVRSVLINDLVRVCKVEVVVLSRQRTVQSVVTRITNSPVPV